MDKKTNKLLDELLDKLHRVSLANSMIAPLEIKYNLGEITKEQYLDKLDQIEKNIKG